MRDEFNQNTMEINDISYAKKYPCSYQGRYSKNDTSS